MNKFHIGQKVYLWHSGYSYFLAIVTDVYKNSLDGDWLYSLDCSCYDEGLEVSSVSEKYLTQKSTRRKDTLSIPKNVWDDVVREWELNK